MSTNLHRPKVKPDKGTDQGINQAKDDGHKGDSGPGILVFDIDAGNKPDGQGQGQGIDEPANQKSDQA